MKKTAMAVMTTAVIAVTLGIGGGSAFADSTSVSNVPKITDSSQTLKDVDSGKTENNTKSAIQGNRDRASSNTNTFVQQSMDAGQNAAKQATSVAGQGTDINGNVGDINGIGSRINALIDTGGSKVISTLVRFASYAGYVGMVLSIIMAIFGFFTKKGRPWAWVGGLLGLIIMEGLIYFVAGGVAFSGNFVDIIKWVFTGQ